MNNKTFFEYPGEPVMIIDPALVRSNIEQMKQRIASSGAGFRPHFKTHQSIAVGQWFRDAGIDKITVSSLEMAQYFAADGWNNITVAFPVNLRQKKRITELAARIDLQLVAEDPEVIDALDRILHNEVGLWIKIDAGYHRTGIAWNNTPFIDQCLQSIRTSSHIRFCGFLSHSGHTYHAKDRSAVVAIHTVTRERMMRLGAQYRNGFPDLLLSMGDTPTCSIAEDLSGIDEWRPGNFVFYDLSQQAWGACDFHQIAAIVVCPVVSVHKERKEVVIYGGAVHFSKEQRHHQGKTIYGQVVRLTDKGWHPEPMEGYITKLSQEHGIVSFDHLEDFDHIKPGDVMGFYPVHSCLTANLLRGYMTTLGQPVDHLSGLKKTIQLGR